MSSLKASSGIQQPNGGGVFRLLNSMLGLIVWAGHLLTVYVVAAVACVLGVGTAGDGARTTLLTVLSILTLGAAVLVAWHALSRYRALRGASDRQFGMSITIGCDAIALVAIMWQLYPIVLVPVCA